MIQRGDQSDRSVSKYCTSKSTQAKVISLKLVSFNECVRRRCWTCCQISVTSLGCWEKCQKYQPK